MQDHEDEHDAGTAAADAEVKRRGRPFQPGQSGNPRGRPKGSRNVTTLMLEALLEGEGETILGKFIERAKQGDSRAQKACIDRLLPAGRDRRVAFHLPEIATEDDGPKATQALLSAVAAGEISASEASTVMKLIDTHMQMLRRRREEAEPSERVRFRLSSVPYNEDGSPPTAEQEAAEEERMAQMEAQAKRNAQEQAEIGRKAREQAEAEPKVHEHCEAGPVARASAEAEPSAQEVAQAEPSAQEVAQTEPIVPEEISAKQPPREPAEPVWITHEQAVAELEAEDEAEAKRKADAELRAKYAHQAAMALVFEHARGVHARIARQNAEEKRAFMAEKWS
ncbi:MAG: DUF5681 domain-containing protein [Hyphomicrobiales bacterium]